MRLDVETIQVQLQNLENQKNNSLSVYQQCLGAISVLNEQLSMIKTKEDLKQIEPEIQGDDNVREMDSRSD